jgi:predicted dehydrogenase
MTVGVGVIGLGFMGRTHIGAYRAAGEACRLRGVFDLDPGRLTGTPTPAGNIDTGDADDLFDPKDVFVTDSLDALLARDDIDAVSVCTPTDTHAEVATAAVRAGKHVLVEKPVALDRSAVGALAREAHEAGVQCMPAMCMRFWPEWDWLASRIREDRTALRGLAFERIGAAPAWGAGFYQDDARSGGALYDLHIHDTDFVVHVLGPPDAVTSVGDRARVTTVYHYKAGPAHVVATGGWLRGGAAFRMRYLAEFEDGTADFDLLREPTLTFSATHNAGEPRTVSAGEGDGYSREVAAFLEAVASGTAAPVTLPDADATLAVLEAEARSLNSAAREPVRTEPPRPNRTRKTS